MCLAIISIGVEVIQVCMLMISTLVLVFSQDDQKVLAWTGYLGCVGETQSFIVGSYVTAVVFPIMIGACFYFVYQTCEADKEGMTIAQFGQGLIALCFGIILAPPGLGFFVYSVCGIPALFPMIGVVLVAEIIAMVLILILMIPDLLLARWTNGTDVPDAIITYKMACTFLVTLLVSAPRCAMMYGMGVGNGYSFAFTTIGAMPVREELGVTGIKLTVGGGSTLSSTLQVAAWFTLVKLVWSLIDVVWKYVRMECMRRQIAAEG
jgi:hypothetical protein